MKLVTFKENSSVRCGILSDKGIVDLTDNFQGVKQILAGGRENLKKIQLITEKITKFTDPSSVELLAPIPDPGKILALAGNYAKHIIEAGLKLGLSISPRKTTVPRPFLKPDTVINHPNSVIPWPVYSKEIDYEIEFAVVIGKTAKCVSPNEAKKYIAGFTIANDVSARSVTFKEGEKKGRGTNFTIGWAANGPMAFCLWALALLPPTKLKIRKTCK